MIEGIMTKHPSLREFTQHLREISMFVGLTESDLLDLAQSDKSRRLSVTSLLRFLYSRSDLFLWHL